MLICIICQLFRSVSDYGKCCIKLKLLPVGVHSCSCANFSGCHGNGSQEIIKKTGEIIIIFIICVIPKCGLSLINTSKDISMLI